MRYEAGLGEVVVKREGILNTKRSHNYEAGAVRQAPPPVRMCGHHFHRLAMMYGLNPKQLNLLA